METPRRRTLLNKVPEVTLYFWVIKVLCTTVGETAADFLDGNLGLGLSRTTLVMSVFLVAALAVQFAFRRYVPFVYWLAVVAISIVGTLITDNLTDGFGVSLVISTSVFALVLAIVFATWWAYERTLSIHTIFTLRREAFYWLAVLFTFALGTAAGDLTAERFAVGYWQSAVLFGSLIGAVLVAHRRFGLNAIPAFWVAYILTRPLGASIGDFMSQAKTDGGLGLGTTVTSVAFLGTILLVVLYLTWTKLDRTDVERLQALGLPAEGRVLVVINALHPSRALVDVVRDRARERRSAFLVFAPENVDEALALLRAATDAPVEGHSAPVGAFDTIETALANGEFDEVILETPPAHVPHWVHADIVRRVERLGVPLRTVPAPA